MSRLSLLLGPIVCLAIFAAGCKDGEGGATEAGAGDMALDVFNCGMANDKGVGASCAAGGGQCRAYEANLCSCDFVKASFCACSKFCTSDGECGSGGARCCKLAVMGATEYQACVPGGCLQNGECPTAPDAGR